MYIMIGLKLDTMPLWNNFGYLSYASKMTCTTSVLISFMSIITLCPLFRHSSRASCNSAIRSPLENLFLQQNDKNALFYKVQFWIEEYVYNTIGRK